MTNRIAARSRTTPDFRIDFIDPLFAVAIHIGFVEGLLEEHWAQEHTAPRTIADIANIALFIAAFWTIAASWVGYHQSIQTKPIKGAYRFVLDIVLLGLYILLLYYFRGPISVALIMAAIYAIYVAWDFYKTKEYANRYYDGQTSPNAFVYVGQCFVGWLQPNRHPRLVGETVTAAWFVFFAILIPFSFLHFTNSDTGKILFALVLVVANSIYRYDKKNRGAWICSAPFKIAMMGAVVYQIAYHTHLLCSD